MVGLVSVDERRVGVRAEQKRRWDREHRPVCACGRPMARARRMCRACYERPGAIRNEQIIALRAAGLRNVEIAAQLGMPRATVSTIIQRLRERGVEIGACPNGRPPKVS